MQAIISPVGRQPYLAPLVAAPVYASTMMGGYSTATLVQGRVRGDKLARMLYADVVIFGREGPCWRGVIESTDANGTLHCVGPQQVLGWHNYLNAGGDATLWHWISAMLGDGGWPSFISHDMTFVQTSPIVLSAAISLGLTTFAAGIAEVVKYSAWQWGFYYERINGVDTCVPHFAAIPTTADYIITLSAEDAATFLGESLDGMVSRVTTAWGATPGYVATVDTNASHYLVEIGRGRDAITTASNLGAAADATLGATALINLHASTKAGSTSSSKTSTIQLASGMPAYPPSIRPGKLAALHGLPSGPLTLMITDTSCVGDSAISVGLGVDSGNIEALLARIG